MNYDLTYENNYNSQKFIDLLKNNIVETNNTEIYSNTLFDNKSAFENKLLLLKDKLIELQNKIEFYKLYSDKINIDKINHNKLNKTIELIDSFSFELNKKIINKGQIIRKSNLIEFEF